MIQQTIGIYSGTDLVSELRRKCPELTFADSGIEREVSRIAVIDRDSHSALAPPPRKSIVRIVLDMEEPSQRRQGEIYIDRKSFLEKPHEYLSFACDLVDAAVHASQLETEVGFLKQIHDLMSLSDAQAVSERITRSVLDLLGLSRGTLFLHDPRLERYVVSFTNDPDAHETGEFLPGIPSDLLQRALSSGHSFAADRASGMIVIPLQVEHDLVGVIRVPLASTESLDDAVVEDVSHYVRAVSSVLGNIYQLSSSRDLAMRDDLTKAFNRRFFDTYLDEEIERSRRYGSLFSIIFLDLDDLKMVNNFYGHLTGSRTLQEVAKRVLTAVRNIDKVIRFGGDEFCIVLPETDQEQAMAVANRVRKSLTAAAFVIDGTVEISITASFGIATYPTHGLSKDDLIRQADAAMYRVKSTTKNAVGIASLEHIRPASAQ
ncbi:MAG TPA: sensor domain-containing diguanylate cyclase [Thermoanaerobaculia bacterium]|nr:sensor domain-containing diguanylate cyclase [Thermoanaerobaculia bacterium]